MSVENNKIIAEFMGVESFKDSLASLHQGKINIDVDVYEQARYHTSWDWLMPVVQKIGDEYLNTPFDETYSRLTEQYENIWTLEDTYNAVVEFINQYNEKQ
uniref:Uncharacterized protein n=1 Tax=Virus NIOZ-UU157 TaxID=2763269 RepID=A0A7S9XGK8_9VIRU|nr:MAG: hypothetical protein NIOZUU157_00049 [Virus NIOZ-UU157]